MFLKSFDIQNSIQMKRTERKLLKELIMKFYSKLTKSDLNEIFPANEVVTILKVQTYDGQKISIYLVENVPIWFTSEDLILPTVFVLWKYPFLLTLTTYSLILPHFCNGANLMIPGVIPPHDGFEGLGPFPKNYPVCVNMKKNKAVIAVGLTTLSSEELIKCKRTGKCVQILHFYGDKLCGLNKSPTSVLPELGPPEFLQHPKLLKMDEMKAELTACTSGCCGGAHKKYQTTGDFQPSSSGVSIASTASKTQEVIEEVVPMSETEQMDQLLMHCLLTVLKYNKSLALPIPTSSFYHLQMLPACPSGKNLDVRKSSYKKIGQFVVEMCNMGLITIEQIKRGVDAIVDFNKQHPKYMEFYLAPPLRPALTASAAPPSPPEVLEGYLVTAEVAPIFKDFGYKVGDFIQTIEVRRHVDEYVKKNKFVDPNNKSVIQIQGELLEILKTTRNRNLYWEELMRKIYNSMKFCCHQVIPGTSDKKTDREPIVMKISAKSGNKKMTVVDNLELHGISIQEIAKQCGSQNTSIKEITGKPSQQLLVQGNQIKFIYNLLKDQHKIPEKYIKGLEEASKKAE